MCGRWWLYLLPSQQDVDHNPRNVWDFARVSQQLHHLAEAVSQGFWDVLQPDERAFTKAEKVTSQGV